VFLSTESANVTFLPAIAVIAVAGIVSVPFKLTATTAGVVAAALADTALLTSAFSEFQPFEVPIVGCLIVVVAVEVELEAVL
jgi:hypothetical protein